MDLGLVVVLVGAVAAKRREGDGDGDGVVTWRGDHDGGEGGGGGDVGGVGRRGGGGGGGVGGDGMGAGWRIRVWSGGDEADLADFGVDDGAIGAARIH